VRKVGKEGRKRKLKTIEEIGLLLYNDLKDLNKTLAGMYDMQRSKVGCFPPAFCILTLCRLV